MREPNLNLVPPNIVGSLARWVFFGIPTGGFLDAVLANDLFDAVGRADSTNRERLADIACFIHNNIPSGCYGSREKLRAWQSTRPSKESLQQHYGWLEPWAG